MDYAPINLIAYTRRMLTILLHSSKTMRTGNAMAPTTQQTPVLQSDSLVLARYLKMLSVEQIALTMKISPVMAEKTHRLLQSFDATKPALPAIDSFLGDIYSGLQVQTFTSRDRDYANEHLFILSGLYGVLRALDTIQPYRLEMGYKLPGNAHDPSQADITSLYAFWGDKIAKSLPKSEIIINLSAVEYTKAVFSQLKSLEGFNNSTIITPKFLTVSPKTGQPTFVTVHAKIARGAFARWLIQKRIQEPAQLKDFNEIGYVYNQELSTAQQPVYVAQNFEGLGLSVRLS